MGGKAGAMAPVQVGGQLIMFVFSEQQEAESSAEGEGSGKEVWKPCLGGGAVSGLRRCQWMARGHQGACPD